MNHINYQKELEKLIEKNQREKRTPTLLLHACCAPCSSYVLEYLSQYFYITVVFYNPNISTDEEYNHRAKELLRFIKEKKFANPVKAIIEDYIPEEFYRAVKGLEECKEGGNRCFQCYSLRLERAANVAKEKGFDYFTTTLSISPLKNSAKLNEIGKELEEKYGVKYLYSDFKKKNGYKRSIELSKEYNLYRQNFCGCEFSKRD
ncbi:MAG: epoxyqueuosine reductase QueH [Eubacterium sp.]